MIDHRNRYKLHEALVGHARDWLANNGCRVVVTNRGFYGLEIVDAIGWGVDLCTVVECKTSLEDLRADRRKRHTTEGASMGDLRYFLTPKGLLHPDKTPEGHGLLELRGSRVYKLRQAPARDRTWRRYAAECEMLRGYCRHLAQEVLRLKNVAGEYPSTPLPEAP